MLQKGKKENVTRKGRSRRWNWEREKREYHKKERKGRCDKERKK
jgi:hypothetical protein